MNIGIATGLGLLFALSACNHPQEAKAAESAYTAELLKCVADAKAPAESGACRKQVDARWSK